MLFSNRSRRDRQRGIKQQEARRRQLARLVDRAAHVETLEDRRLLAVVTHPTTDTVVNIVEQNDTYVDSGGVAGDYSPDENGVQTLDSGSGILEVDFTTFSVETSFDGLEIFDGPNTAAVSLGVFDDGTGSPGTVTASGSTLTFEFLSNDVVEQAGWEADVNVYAQDLVIAGTAADSNIVVGLDGSGDLSVTIGGIGVLIAPFGTSPFDTSELNSITVNGGAGNDTLTVDLSNGNPIPSGGLEFSGGTQTGGTGDVLTIIGTVTTQTLNYTTTGADGNNGSVDLDGSVITYTGLEPINAGNAADTILNLPLAFANDATLQDSTNGGEIEIIDNGATFEDTVIPNPTNSLTVNLGDQGDLLNVTTLDTGFAASLIINGGAAATDDVQLTNVNLDTNGGGRGLRVTA